MKKLKVLLILLSFFLCNVGVASALNFFDYNDTWKRIDHYGEGPEAWFELELPTLSNTSNPSWQYDSLSVTKFDITLTYNNEKNINLLYYLNAVLLILCLRMEKRRPGKRALSTGTLEPYPPGIKSNTL